jgi:hypothetical protein
MHLSLERLTVSSSHVYNMEARPEGEEYIYVPRRYPKAT